MESITIGEIAAALVFIVGLIGSMKYLTKEINNLLDKKLEPMCQSIKDLDEAQCKNYLVSFLKDKEMGNPQDPVETERAYEVYDHYVNVLHKNSYIHDKWQRLMK